MKQIIQDLKNGQTLLEEVPVPQVKGGYLLIRTSRTLVSLGTERMLVEFGKANLIDKARQQPDKVKQVLDKMRTDGLMPTLEAVFNKLGQPLPLGYCNVGTVVEVGRGVTEFHVGDRVVSNGPHAEFVCVPKNLCAKIPDGVSDDEAAFTVIGSIALQGIRNLNPQIGETIVVTGLGLIGLLTAQLLKANGCRVIGLDFDQTKIALCDSFGILAYNISGEIDIVSTIASLTDGHGADGTIITASSHSDDIIHQACEMTRKRGRIVLVGVVGMNMRRDDFYKKELSFQVSCSYGPGRYDEEYEIKGNDYPLPYVRWTEKRNFETVLQALASRSLHVAPLITETVELSDFQKIYGDMRKKGSIASIIRFSDIDADICRKIPVSASPNADPNGKIGIIGAGNFTAATMIPALVKAHAPIKYIASAQGLSAKTLAKRCHAEFATSDYREILEDREVSQVLITTRHKQHASMVVESLQAGKNVFVEKPLCITEEELAEIIEAHERYPRQTITVGFNRRFSPFTVKMKQLLSDEEKNIVATMNAGFIPPESWVQDMAVGGGRIIGEACHFIDLCSFLAGSAVTSVCMNAMGTAPQENTDNATIMLRYANGTNAVINYFANGSKAYSKERIEVFDHGKILILDNWRTLSGYGYSRFAKLKGRLDKGHGEQFARLVNGLKDPVGNSLIPFEEIVNATKASFACIRSLRERKWIDLD